VTDLLKKAFDAASRLPADEQDVVAEWLLAELATEQDWERRFARTRMPCPCLHGKHQMNTREARRRNWLLGRFEVQDDPPVPKGLSRLPDPVKERAREAYGRFAENPDHPGLRFKRIRSTEPIYSVRVAKDYRALGIREDDTMIWFWIGTHADYDELISRL
jgi:hypothetical protein